MEHLHSELLHQLWAVISAPNPWFANYVTQFELKVTAIHCAVVSGRKHYCAL